MVEKYVITGGPSSGKTTTIEILKKRGYKVVEEAARKIIENEKKKGREIVTFDGNVSKFQIMILKLQLKNEKKFDKFDGKIFLDRGMPDGLVYYELTNTSLDKEIVEESKKTKRDYKKVFLLEMVPYKIDQVRKEPVKIAKKLHKMLKKVYVDLGYQVIKVPVMEPEKRVEFILERC
ncbi:MAG: ATP-binding protein [Candidatus Pacearchaeota archaeon]|jgi:predicted ATPase